MLTWKILRHLQTKLIVIANLIFHCLQKLLKYLPHWRITCVQHKATEEELNTKILVRFYIVYLKVFFIINIIKR